MGDLVKFRPKRQREPAKLAFTDGVYDDTDLRSLIDNWIVPTLVDDWIARVQGAPESGAHKDDGEHL